MTRAGVREPAAYRRLVAVAVVSVMASLAPAGLAAQPPGSGARQAGAPGDARPRTGRRAAPAQVVAQTYIWVQHYGERKERLEDHFDEAFAATARAGYTAVQGFLSWFATPEAAGVAAAALKAHRLSISAAYADGPLHDDRAAATIDRIVDQARRAHEHGLRMAIVSPSTKPEGAHKTDDELVVQAKNLDLLGGKLRALGISLAIHAHDREMADGAREWYSNLRRTDPANVGICLDVHWVLRGGADVMTLVRDAGTRTGDLHLRNSRGGIWLEELADGDVDYAQVAAHLRSQKYSGTYTVELAYEKGTQRTRSIEENLRRSREYVRRTFGL